MTILLFLVCYVAFWIIFLVLFTLAAIILRFLETHGIDPNNWF